MSKSGTLARALTPAISIRKADHIKLQRLVSAYASIAPDVSEFLAGEIDRAKVSDEVAPTVVRMGSWVSFRDETTKRTQFVQLVYPDEANIQEKKVAVMTPIGAALLGVGAGKAITFHTRDGEARNLTVLAVSEEKPNEKPNEKPLASGE